MLFQDIMAPLRNCSTCEKNTQINRTQNPCKLKETQQGIKCPEYVRCTRRLSIHEMEVVGACSTDN